MTKLYLVVKAENEVLRRRIKILRRKIYALLQQKPRSTCNIPLYSQLLTSLKIVNIILVSIVCDCLKVFMTFCVIHTEDMAKYFSNFYKITIIVL